MGNKIDKAARGRISNAKGLVRTGQDKTFNKKVGGKIEKPFRKGTTGKQREASRLNALQLQKEQARAVEAEDEIALRRGLAGSKIGRRSLIQSSPGSLSTNLGGT